MEKFNYGFTYTDYTPFIEKKNKKILKKKIIVTFNFSVDIYRTSITWDPKDFVALRDYDLNEILEHPFKYRIIVFKNLLLNKNFTLSRYDNLKMQNIFLNSNKDKIYKNLIKYFDELNETAKKLILEIDFVVTHPYCVYSIEKKNDKLLLDKELNKKVQKLICDSFKSTNKIKKILITNVSDSLELQSLTFDKRHLKSKKIQLKKYKEVCNNL